MALPYYLASGLYNSLYYRTSREQCQVSTRAAVLSIVPPSFWRNSVYHPAYRLPKFDTAPVNTRRLAAANRSRVSIPATIVFGQGQGVIDPVKMFTSSSLITMQNLVVVRQTVWTLRMKSDKCWVARAGLLVIRAGLKF